MEPTQTEQESNFINKNIFSFIFLDKQVTFSCDPNQSNDASGVFCFFSLKKFKNFYFF